MKKGGALVCGGNRGTWSWTDRPDDADVISGIEAWVYALKGKYQWGGALSERDLETYDPIILNLNPEHLEGYDRILRSTPGRGRVVGLFEGGLADISSTWRLWSRVADRCHAIIAINGHGLSYMRSLTSRPVALVGIPYPVDGVRRHAIAIEERGPEILLCAPLLSRPLDYLAARPLGRPMIGFERTFPRRPYEIRRHRSLDKGIYLRRAGRLYSDPNLDILPETTPQSYLSRVARTSLWMNLDSRYTWGRNVLDAAALGVPVVSTRETWHAPQLFPDLVVSSPYDIDGATGMARRLLEDGGFYSRTVAAAAVGLEEYGVDRCMEKLGGLMAVG